jgi:hypothetical protein
MKKKIPVFLFLVLLLLAALACSAVAGSPEGASLENLRMAFDEGGNSPTTSFAPSDVLYVVGDINNAPAGTLVDAEWRAVQIEGYAPDELIYEQTISDFAEERFTGTIFFELANDSGWPVGDYEVDIYLDGDFVESVPFSVQ